MPIYSGIHDLHGLEVFVDLLDVHYTYVYTQNLVSLHSSESVGFYSP